METAEREMGGTARTCASTAMSKEDGLADAGAGAAGCEMGASRFAQQGRAQPGQTQLAAGGIEEKEEAPDVPASIKPSRKTHAIFAALLISDYFFAALASASSSFLMYLAGSLSKSLRQSLQQNLISRPASSLTFLSL